MQNLYELKPIQLSIPRRAVVVVVVMIRYYYDYNFHHQQHSPHLLSAFWTSGAALSPSHSLSYSQQPLGVGSIRACELQMRKLRGRH